jgi:hypothetical protein
MSKTFSILFLFLFLASCGKSGNSNDGSGTISNEMFAEDSTSAARSNEDVFVPNLAFTFDVNAKLIGFNRNQEYKIETSIDLIKQVVASEKFKRRVLNKTYRGKKTYVDNNGLSNRAIYNRILQGAEKLGNTSRNNTMDLELQLYQDNNSQTVGYTYANVIRVWMNKKFFNAFRPDQVAGNMFHEWLHKLGFTHDVRPTPSRQHSVPYAIGYIIRDLSKEMNR